MPEVSGIDKENLESVMRETNIQGVSIAYQSQEGPLEETIIGKTDDAHATPRENVGKDTMLGAASLSKPIFAYLVLKLIEKGVLSRAGESSESGLDRPLHEILSLNDFVKMHGKALSEEDMKKAQAITPRMLLSHSSGLGMDESAKLDFEPGTQHAYSGFGLMYLQQAIEQITNKPLEILADEEVFKPLGMNQSTFLLPEPESISSSQMRKKAHAHNSVHTTAKDYTTFTRSWMKDPSPFMQKAFEPQIRLTEDYQKLPGHSESATKGLPEFNKEHLAWGLGFALELDDEGKAIKAFHTGDMSEIRAQVALDLKTQSSAVFFSLGLNHAESNGHVLGPLVITPKIPIPHAHSWFYTKFRFAKSPEELIGGPNSGIRKPELNPSYYLREDADRKENKAMPKMFPDSQSLIKNSFADKVSALLIQFDEITNGAPPSKEQINQAFKVAAQEFISQSPSIELSDITFDVNDVIALRLNINDQLESHRPDLSKAINNIDLTSVVSELNSEISIAKLASSEEVIIPQQVEQKDKSHQTPFRITPKDPGGI